MEKYRVLVNRVVEEFAWIEVEAENTSAAVIKAEHESHDWPDWNTSIITDVEAQDIEEA